MKTPNKNKKHYVYRLTDPVTGEYYIGSRSCEDILTDPYMGSYKVWKPIDTNRLIKEIIKSDFTTRDTAIEYECYLIKKYIKDELNRNYHIPNEGFGNYNKSMSSQQKEKISKTNKEKNIKPPSQLGKQGYWKGKTRPDISKKLKGRIISDEQRNKIRIANIGKAKTEEIILKLRNANIGKILNEDHRKKISISRKKSVLQYSMDGILVSKYDSIKTAAEKTGIGKGHICRCCKNKRNSAGGYMWKYDL
jgi:hypothetical protein